MKTYITDTPFTDERAYYYPAGTRVTLPDDYKVPKGWVVVAEGENPKVETPEERDMRLATGHAKKTPPKGELHAQRPQAHAMPKRDKHE